MKQDKISQFLLQVPLFQDLNQHEIERIEEITISRFIPKKGIIFAEGEMKEAVFFIMDGLVKTYKTDENGHEQIVSFLKTGDMFPHTGFFHLHPYPATAEAIIETNLLAIPVQTFEQLMLGNPEIAIKMMRVMGAKIRELQEKLQVLTGQDVRNRVISFLIMLADQHGVAKDNKITINLPMTHQEFANSVGTTRETINRLLNQLDKDGILKTERNRIVIFDMDVLKQQREHR